MAGFMDSVNKGLEALNVKTSNLMETAKLKSAITARENEIASIMKVVGETVYVNRSGFSIDKVADQLDAIKGKYEEIENCKEQIALIEEKEKKYLADNASGKGEARVFCIKCGAPNKMGSNFCEKCGKKLSV